MSDGKDADSSSAGTGAGGGAGGAAGAAGGASGSASVDVAAAAASTVAAPKSPVKSSSSGATITIADTNSAKYSTRDADEAAARGADVNVIFALPDGSSEKATFSQGHTVDMLKYHLVREKGYTYADITFTLGGKVMIDPLSLADFPAISKATAPVTIDVAVKGGAATTAAAATAADDSGASKK